MPSASAAVVLAKYAVHLSTRKESRLIRRITPQDCFLAALSCFLCFGAYYLGTGYPETRLTRASRQSVARYPSWIVCHTLPCLTLLTQDSCECIADIICAFSTDCIMSSANYQNCRLPLRDVLLNMQVDVSCCDVVPCILRLCVFRSIMFEMKTNVCHGSTYV